MVLSSRVRMEARTTAAGRAEDFHLCDPTITGEHSKYSTYDGKHKNLNICLRTIVGSIRYDGPPS